MIYPPNRDHHAMLQRNLHLARAQWKQTLADADSSIDPANVRAAVEENPIGAAIIVAALGCISSQLIRLPIIKGVLRVSIGTFTKTLLKNFPTI
ncbi:MAG: hypothetical protein ABI579_03320 [Candidatus Sumerlaeota bacterium]